MADPSDSSRSGSGKHHRGGRESLIEMVVIVVTALGLALLIQTLLVKPFRIPSESMVPTLEVGQRVLVNRVEGRWGSPERFDVVVFKPPSGASSQSCGIQPGEEYAPGLRYEVDLEAEKSSKMPCPKGTQGRHSENFIKRVVGLPGDRLSVEHGRVRINGQYLVEPYVASDNDCLENDEIGADCNFPTEIVIQPGEYYVMGDNRNTASSADSRFWGPVPEEWIVGEAFMTYWPVDRIGGF